MKMNSSRDEQDVRYPSKCEGRLASFGDFPNLLATINCHSSAATASAAAAAANANANTPSSLSYPPLIRSNRQQGPVLLEIMQVQWSSNPHRRSHANTDGASAQKHPSQWSTYPVSRSRSNPSLGTSLASTCLDVMPTAPTKYSYPQSARPNWETTPPSPVATGLTTGALCLHTFGPSSSDESSPTGNGWIPRLEFYQSPTRQHRPATCVAWRHAQPDQSPMPQMVAIGLVASSSTTASSLPDPFPAREGSDPSRASRASSSNQGGRAHGGGSGGAVHGIDPFYRGGSPATSEAKVAGQGMGDSGGSAYHRPTMGANATAARGYRGGVVASDGMANLATGTNVSGANANVAMSDREYCCLLWDVEHQSSSGADSLLASSSGSSAAWSLRRTSLTANGRSTPLHKLSHQMGVASLAWLMEGNVLACGGQLRSLQLYDMRGGGGGPAGTAGGGVAAPVSVSYAHNFAVQIRAGSDPNRPWLLASFCKSPSEPVKIWDCRKMDSASGPVSEVKMKSADYISNVSAVQWSPAESGRLVVAIGNTVHEYDVLSPSGIVGGNFGAGSASGSASSAVRPVPVQTLYANDLIADFCLPAFDKRIMAVPPGGNPTVFDTPRHTFAPVAVSRRDGRIASAFGLTLWIGSSIHGPAAMEKNDSHRRSAEPPKATVASNNSIYNDDISAVMMRRAKCQHVVRYSMDPASNIKVLLQETNSGPWGERHSLLRVWSWIERVEELCGDTVEGGDGGTKSGFYWPAKGLLDAGVGRLVSTLTVQHDPDVETFSDTLHCVAYDSIGRTAALASCGWAGKFSLVNVLAECEDYEEFERSAAVAAWHGDIGAAVDALDRGSTHIRGLLSSDRRRSISQYETTIFTSHYADLLELVSVCVAGFRAGDLESSASSVWRRSCSNLMQRVGATGRQHVSSSRIAYLRGLLRFLLCLGSSTGYHEVLGDETLSLVDRVAFACRFLPRDDLEQFIESSAVACQSSGDCEGLILTGVDQEGIRILQAFVDCSTDVQSAALITSRVILPPDWSLERGICLEWLDSYRSLLNTWQMWQSRAMFDVDRADVLRKVKTRRIAAAYSAPAPPAPLSAVSKSSGSVSMSSRSRTGLGSRSKSAASRQADPDVMASIPAQLDARCNYCSAPLGLKSQDTHSSQLLSKMKPVLSCCPQCRKPLPRCAICLLPLGTLNPYMELLASKDSASRQVPSGIGNAGFAISSPTHVAPGGYSTDLSTLASLPLAEWFSWCMRCKHGGHAHHWVGWFAKHDVCPVSGCNCRCQFDGIKTLKRGLYAPPPPSAPPAQPSEEGMAKTH